MMRIPAFNPKPTQNFAVHKPSAKGATSKLKQQLAFKSSVSIETKARFQGLKQKSNIFSDAASKLMTKLPKAFGGTKLSAEQRKVSKGMDSLSPQTEKTLRNADRALHRAQNALARAGATQKGAEQFLSTFQPPAGNKAATARTAKPNVFLAVTEKAAQKSINLKPVSTQVSGQVDDNLQDFVARYMKLSDGEKPLGFSTHSELDSKRVVMDDRFEKLDPGFHQRVDAIAKSNGMDAPPPLRPVSAEVGGRVDDALQGLVSRYMKLSGGEKPLGFSSMSEVDSKLVMLADRIDSASRSTAPSGDTSGFDSSKQLTFEERFERLKRM